MNEPEQSSTKAIIYARVSSIAQTNRGSGLAGQRQTCRDFARQRGLEVVAEFEDDVSGALVKRPGMDAMLDYNSHSST